MANGANMCQYRESGFFFSSLVVATVLPKFGMIVYHEMAPLKENYNSDDKYFLILCTEVMCSLVLFKT